MHKKSIGHATEKTGSKTYRNLLQLLLLKCTNSVNRVPSCRSSNKTFLMGGLLILQHQVMFVQLEADDCDLGEKKRIPDLAGSF